MPNVANELATILVNNFDVAESEISPSKTLDELDVDSVATVEFIDIVKEKFGIEIDEDELTNKNTVEQVTRTVTEKVEG